MAKPNYIDLYVKTDDLHPITKFNDHLICGLFMENDDKNKTDKTAKTDKSVLNIVFDQISSDEPCAGILSGASTSDEGVNFPFYFPPKTPLTFKSNLPSDSKRQTRLGSFILPYSGTRIFLIKRKDDTMHFPGGLLEESDTREFDKVKDIQKRSLEILIKGAKREVNEEVGNNIDLTDCKCVPLLAYNAIMGWVMDRPDNPITQNIMTIFRANVKETVVDKSKLQESEIQDAQWISLRDFFINYHTKRGYSRHSAYLMVSEHISALFHETLDKKMEKFKNYEQKFLEEARTTDLMAYKIILIENVLSRDDISFENILSSSVLLFNSVKRNRL